MISLNKEMSYKLSTKSMWNKPLNVLMSMDDVELMSYLIKRYESVPELVPIAFRDVIEARKILEVIHD